MGTKRLYPAKSKQSKRCLRVSLVILLLLTGCQQSGISADKTALLSKEDAVQAQHVAFGQPEAVSEAELDKQLKINRDALLKGSSEQIRIDAATVMLFSDEPLAREILLAALKQSENAAARAAVCKALSQTRDMKEPVKNKDDFIQPLMDVLTTEDAAVAKLAAEATLIFEYKQILKPLVKILTMPSLTTQAKLNMIYALKLQPYKEVIFQLMDLLDDPEHQVSAEAEKALQYMGIPVGKDAKTRKEIRDEIERKGIGKFQRERWIRQENRMAELKAELDLWRGLYLTALGRIYDGLSDDAAKGKFLIEHLGNSEAAVRLWALEKVSQWRVGTKSNLPVELGPVLVNLISDKDREVRLKTAKLLSLMGQLDSAQRLLEQLEIEQDDEVRTELFAALGGACYYAFLPDSPVKVNKDIRKQTLEWAVKYLAQTEPKKAQKGAEVMKKLLEQDGLEPPEVDRYLGLLTKRYNQQKDKSNGALRGELLSAMAGLCAQSVYKAEAAKLFKGSFEEALRDETDLVREAAVDGLVHIDKTRALKILRKDYINDSSSIIRKKLVELAAEVGGNEDLPWLAEKIATTAEGESAWQTMLKIFKRSDAAVLNGWLGRFKSQEVKLSDEQMASFLEIAERKAGSENELKMLKAVRKELAQLYRKSGRFEQAAGYLGKLYESADVAKEKELILADLMDSFLRWPNVEQAAKLVDNRLLEKDLGPDDAVVRSIDNYLSSPPSGADPNVVLTALLDKIKAAEDRPKWAEQKKRLSGRLQPNRPKAGGK